MSNDSVFFHITKPDLIPVGMIFDTFNNLDSYKDSSLENILIQDLLDYFKLEDIDKVLLALKLKTAIGGRLEIQGTDIKRLACSICFNEITDTLAASILYPHKKSMSTMSKIIKILKSIGFEIQIKKFINIFEYYLSCRRLL